MFQKNIVEIMTTNILCSIRVFPKIVTFMRAWKNIVEPDKPQMTGSINIAFWITKATYMHS
jgi:hypothetical protein